MSSFDSPVELLHHNPYEHTVKCTKNGVSVVEVNGGKKPDGLHITTIEMHHEPPVVIEWNQQIDRIVANKTKAKPSLCSPPKRFVFVLLSFLGMVILYMLRVNLSVTIVSMVRTNASVVEHFGPLLRNGNTSVANVTESGSLPVDTTFDWDEKTQGLVLGSFFWGYVWLQLPGGRMAERFGAKWLLFVGIFGTSVLTIVSPLAAQFGHQVFIACRVLEGLFESCFIPAMHSMIAKWVPASERSTMVGIIYSGPMMGTMLTMPVAAILCESSVAGGWPSVFYVFGVAGLVWAVAWALFVAECPQTHPTISQHELRLILTGQNNTTQKRPKIPWCELLCSGPLWALATAHFAQNYGFYTMLTQMPRYFSGVLGFDLKSNGLYSALPYLSQSVVASSIGFLSDRLYRTDRFRLSTLRKSFNTAAFLGTAACLLVVTRIGNDATGNIVLLTLALGINGLCMSGYSVTHVDMSPNFAGTLMGITNGLANLAGVLSPIAVGQIMSFVVPREPDQLDPETIQQRTLLAWNYVFYMSAAVYTFGGVVFALFGSNQLQHWNDPNSSVSGSLKFERRNSVK